MGSAVNDLSFTSPRMPCAPPICATQMRSATAGYPEAESARGRGSLGGGSRRLGRSCGLLGLFRARLAFLARDRAHRVVARLALHQPCLVEKAQHAIGRQRALGEPSL